MSYFDNMVRPCLLDRYKIGEDNYALSFNGTDSIVLIEDSESLKPTHFTYSFFIFADRVNVRQALISKRSLTGGGFPDFEYRIGLNDTDTTDNDKLDVRMYTNSSSSDLISNGSLQEKQWYHIAFAHSGNESKIYINGQIDSFTNTSVTYDNTKTDNLIHIGNIFFRGNNVRPFKGLIKNIKMYQSYITDSQALKLYNSEEINEQLAANYDFSTGEGNILIDKSGNNNNGNIINAEWIKL